MNSILAIAATALLSSPHTKAPEHPTRSIVETAVAAGSFETLAAALTQADLVGALEGEGPFTVFAPTDDAFAKLPKETLEALLLPRNKGALASVLTYHVVSGDVSAKRAIAAGSAETLQSDEVSFAIADGRLRVNDATVVSNDIQCSNGVIHVIDSVLLPPSGLELQPAGRLIIGVYSERPSRALAAQLGIDRKGTLLISSVTAGGPAERAGLEAYDVVTAIDGEPATDASLKQAKARVGFGGHLQLDVLRRGKPQHIEVEVGVDSH